MSLKISFKTNHTKYTNITRKPRQGFFKSLISANINPVKSSNKFVKFLKGIINANK